MQTHDRRSFLLRAGALGCSAAASPLVTPVALAAGPWDARLVVIILRGGMDGLDAIRPYGDPSFTDLRPKLSADQDATHDLNGFFAAHPALNRLMPLWSKGQLAFVHAVSTPYRDKRSHFDGQDMLEAGTASLHDGTRDGWLNRLLQNVPHTEARTAFAIGRDDMRVLAGSAPFARWSPDATLTISPQTVRLLDLVYHDDPSFREAADEAIALSNTMQFDGLSLQPEEMMQAMQSARQQMAQVGDDKSIAAFAATQLMQDTRIAAFSINGWDTHARQERGISRALDRLSDVVLTLNEDLGEVWEKTTIIAMTEFGRTVRENGTGGTDHGTGGAMILAGGAIRGGEILGNWPGLKETDLYERRDLMPTADVRGYAAWAMRDLFGLDKSVLEDSVFPKLDMGADPKLIL